jgi:hypothetical protein
MYLQVSTNKGCILYTALKLGHSDSILDTPAYNMYNGSMEKRNKQNSQNVQIHVWRFNLMQIWEQVSYGLNK